MTRPVRLRAAAERDLEEAARWYEEQRPGLGTEFLEEALRLLASVGESPNRYPVIHRATRRALMRRFPFGAFYRIEADCVVVVAILHGSRNPARWKGRS